MTTPLSEAQSLPRKSPTKANATYIQYVTFRDIPAHKVLLTALLDELTHAIGRKREAHNKLVRTAGRLILANLVHTVFSRNWLAISLKESAYTTGQYLNHNLFLSYGATKATLDKMEEMGWLEEPKKGSNLTGQATLYAPTPWLEETIAGWLYAVEKPFHPPHILLSWDEKQGKKKVRHREPLLALPDSHPDMVRLSRINAFLSQQTYALKAPVTLIYRRDTKPYFLHGGRIYTDIQRLPARKAKVRLNTLINGQPVVEIDLKANHIRMAAALQGVELPADPYIDIANHLGVTRDQVKLTINRSIGSSHAGRNEWGVAHPDDDEIDLPLATFKSIKEEAQRTYPFLTFDESLGLKLQSLEGQIMLQAMDRLLKLGIVSLPIHDALMVADGMLSVTAAEQILKGAWSEVLGVSFAPHVTLNRP